MGKIRPFFVVIDRKLALVKKGHILAVTGRKTTVMKREVFRSKQELLTMARSMLL